MKTALLLVAATALVASAFAADPTPATDGATVAGRHPVVFTEAPRRIPSNASTDAPLLGNGDFLAALGGSPEKPVLYLCKNDLWELRPNGGPRPLARLTLDLPALKGAPWQVTQDLRRATTTGVFKKQGLTLTVESAVAATENLMWVKISAEGGSVSGKALLRAPDAPDAPKEVGDIDAPVTVGRENHGGGRYYFKGAIGDVRVFADPAEALKTNDSGASAPSKPENFDGRTTFRTFDAPRMTGSVGVSAWFKAEASGGEANYILCKGEWNKAYSLGLSSGRLRWTVNGSSVETAAPVATGKWIHAVGVFDGGALKLFLDGKQVATSAPAPDGTQVVERAYKAGTHGVVRDTGAACALRVPGAPDGGFTVEPGKPVVLVVTASGLANTADYRADAVRRAEAATPDTLAALRQAHDAWWEDFWNKSFVEIPDKAIERRIVLSHYGLGCASRLAHFPPALYGWTLGTGTPMWGGAYFNNYNFFAAFYGLYAGNHIGQALPCDDAVIDSLPLGKAWAKDERAGERMCGNYVPLKDAPGILLPVSMLPYGVCGAPTSWGQRTDASYACVPLAYTWYATYDRAFAERAYPFVREVATFWEHYLVWENGRYADHNDAVLENSGRDTNPIVALAMVRQVMNLALDMSRELGVDAGRREKWTHIRDHMSDYPVCTVGDLPPGSALAVPRTPDNLALPIFRYSEKGTPWQNGNTVGIQHIFPCDGIGLGVRPELLERARNQIRVMGRWVDLNGCNSFYPAAARVGYDPEEILKHLRHWVDTASPNGMRADNPHGMEQFSVAACTVQEMLMQSFDGTLRLFPDWPRKLDARFGTLRARGAFLVSAALKNGVVSGVSIRSEKGRDLPVVNPWPGSKVRVTRDGKPAETVSGEKFTLKTASGETLELSPQS